MQGNWRVFFQALLSIFIFVSDADHSQNPFPKISVLFLENLYEKRVDYPCSLWDGYDSLPEGWKQKGFLFLFTKVNKTFQNLPKVQKERGLEGFPSLKLFPLLKPLQLVLSKPLLHCCCFSDTFLTHSSSREKSLCKYRHWCRAHDNHPNSTPRSKLRGSGSFPCYNLKKRIKTTQTFTWWLYCFP